MRLFSGPLLVLVIFLGVGFTLGENSKDTRVAGGSDAINDEFPSFSKSSEERISFVSKT